MKAAFFVPSMGGGGAERMYKRLMVGFVGAGVSVDLVLVAATGPLLHDLPPDIRIVDLKTSRVLSSAGPLRRYLEAGKPDVLISTLDHANLISVLARSGIPGGPRLILREANTMSVASAGSSDFRYRFVPSLARLLYPRADAVVAVSQGVAKDLVEKVKIPAAMVRVIYNPSYDADIHYQMKESVAHPWFSDGGPPVVLSAARLNPQKRFDTLIKAFSLARRERPLRLVILGEGQERRGLERLVRELGLEESVSLPGATTNPYSYMAKADLYVLSSAWEGLPNSLIEAMACGLPVVSTDCPSGPREILEADDIGPGPYGSLVPVDDVERMAEAILLETTARRDRAFLLKRAAQFSSSRSVSRYLELIWPGRRFQ